VHGKEFYRYYSPYNAASVDVLPPEALPRYRIDSINTQNEVRE
jgi:hypothetical protein